MELCILCLRSIKCSKWTGLVPLYSSTALRTISTPSRVISFSFPPLRFIFKISPVSWYYFHICWTLRVDIPNFLSNIFRSKSLLFPSNNFLNLFIVKFYSSQRNIFGVSQVVSMGVSMSEELFVDGFLPHMKYLSFLRIVRKFILIV